MTISVAAQSNASLITGLTGQEAADGAGLDLFQLLFSELSALGADGDLLEGFQNGQLPNLDAAIPADATLEVRMKTVVEEIQVLTKAGVDVSKIQNSEDLQSAYIKLGLNPAEAKLRADKTEEVLKYMDAYLHAMKTGKHPQLPMPFLIADSSAETSDKSMIDIWTEQKIEQAFKYTRRETEIVTTLKTRILNKEPLVDAPEFQEISLGDLATKEVAEIKAEIPVEEKAKEETLADSDVMQKLVADLTNTKQPTEAKAEFAAMAQANPNAKQQDKQPATQEQTIADAKVADKAENNEKAFEQKPTEAPSIAKTADKANPVEIATKQDNAQLEASKDLTEANKSFRAETEVMDEIEVTNQEIKPEKRTASANNPIDWKGEKSTLESADMRKPTSETITAMKPTQLEVQVQVQADGSVAYVNPETGDVVAQQDLPRANQQQASFSEQLRNAAHGADVANQTKLHIKPLAEKGGGQIRIDLNPPELGEIEVELKIEDGVASGRISVKNPEVLEQLARDLKVLQQGLAESGLELKDENMTFAVMRDDKEQSQNGKQHARGEQQQSDNDKVELAEAQPKATKWVSPNAMVDMDV